MPFTLSRRHFLTSAVAAGASSFCRAEDSTPSEQVWALFSDSHIAADKATLARGVNVTEHLQQAIREVLAMKAKPCGLMLNGDCALGDGQPGDYATLVELMQPLQDARVPLHITMGNHDDRLNFWETCRPLDENDKLIDHKHLAVMPGPLVNWVLLDSLDKVNATPGLIGEAQLGWLDRTLRELPDKPTLLLCHHNLQGVVADGKKHTGITDTEALLTVIRSHAKVKAFIYGHTHNWSVKTEASGLHLVNLPPIAYCFDKTRPSGWVTARVTATSLDLELHSLDPAHPEHGQKHMLAFAGA